MSTQALATIEPAQLATAVATGGIGFKNPLFLPKPATIELVQKTTRQEGAIPGKLRITSNNEHLDELHVVLLDEPRPQMACFEGDEFSQSSKICFSTTCDTPHELAQIPQALRCSIIKNGKRIYVCKKADWSKYRQTKKREDMPKCREYYHLILIDRVLKLPYYLNVRGTSLDNFRVAMQEVGRLALKMQAAGENPNIFDISFKIFPRPVTDKKGVYYVLGFKDYAPIKKEDREKFGALYMEFLKRRTAFQEEAEAQEAAAEAEAVSADTTEAPATPAVPLVGTVVPKDEVITI
jgi:hypothetical protein